MKLKYYGTAAAEGVPALYCSCNVCRYSKKTRGKNVRTRSQALVNNSLLIDMPPDTLYHYHIYDLPLEKIEHVLITHCHADHLDIPTFNYRSNGFVQHPLPPLNIYGSMPSIDTIFDGLRKSGVLEKGKWNLNEIAPYKKKNINGFEVVPLKANHDFRTYPLIYSISDGDKRMLYGNDTGYFLDETWEYLDREKPYFNMVSLDCTMGIADCKNHAHHMNVDTCVSVKERLINTGCADKKTIFILHHFSHNGHLSYDEIVPLAEDKGFLVSYDGMEIEF